MAVRIFVPWFVYLVGNFRKKRDNYDGACIQNGGVDVEISLRNIHLLQFKFSTTATTLDRDGGGRGVCGGGVGRRVRVDREGLVGHDGDERLVSRDGDDAKMATMIRNDISSAH